MDSKHTSNPLKLPNDLIDRCIDEGKERVYRHQCGYSEASTLVSTHRAEVNPVLQANGAAAEVAFCLYVGIDPFTALNWLGGWRPEAFDLIYPFGFKIDVKNTALAYRYLVWPIGKNHLFAGKDFHALVLVKGDITGNQFLIAGWVSKKRFWREHEVADAGHPLNAGTWNMHESVLWPASDFRASNPLAAIAIRAGKQWEYINNEWPLKGPPHDISACHAERASEKERLL